MSLIKLKKFLIFSSFLSPQQKMLINSIKECFLIEFHAPDPQKKNLSDFCPTQWVEKVTGLDDFEDLFAAIAFCFEKMSMNMGSVCNQDTLAKATSFYKLMAFFDFLSFLVITRSVLDLTLLVTQLLQGPAIDNLFADFFKDDFPCPKALEAELDLWETY